MGCMTVVVISIVVAVVAVVAATTAYVVAGRRASAAAAEQLAEQALSSETLQLSIDRAVEGAVERVREQAIAERDAAVAAALEQSAVLQREHLGSTATQFQHHVSADLAAKKDVIDARLDQVHAEMRNELNKLGELINSMGRRHAETFGQVDRALQAHAEVASTLADSTRSLREALANPQARGQWGERMAEDVLRLAGFQENVNYHKQTQVEGGSGRPDYTFPMPKGHALFMDVKFPMASYLRYLEAGSAAEREAHLKRFLADVRLRVRELARRDYSGEADQPTVDYVLLFLPNEQLTGFIHEHDPALLDDAMHQKVVLCSPLTLFAFLGVIRQAFDSFMIEQTSDEILKLLGRFGVQWHKYVDQVDKVKKRFDAVDKEFDQLVGTRRRQLEKPLIQLEALRLQRGLPVDGELFATDVDEADEADTPAGGSIRALGA